MIIRLLIVSILLTAFNGFAHAQTIVSQSNIVKTEILIPLNFNTNCNPVYLNINETQMICSFDLGFAPKAPFTFDVESNGEMYFRHEYEIQGQNLLVIFINAAWLDSPDLIEGDELRFGSEVLSYFSTNSVSLMVTLIGPK